MGRWERIEKWLVFIVYVAVLPAIVIAMALPLFGHQLTLVAVFGRGEMLLSALAIAADGASEMIGVQLSGYRLTICRLCVAMVVLIAIIYGLITTGTVSIVGKTPDMEVLAYYSLLLLFLAVVVSAPSKLWTMGEKNA